jgi:aconitate hydratase
LRLTGRKADRIALVEAYSKEQGLWRKQVMNLFYRYFELDMSTVKPVWQDQNVHKIVLLAKVPKTFQAVMELTLKPTKPEKERLENEGGGGTAVEAQQANLNLKQPLCD